MLECLCHMPILAQVLLTLVVHTIISNSKQETAGSLLLVCVHPGSQCNANKPQDTAEIKKKLLSKAQ